MPRGKRRYRGAGAGNNINPKLPVQAGSDQSESKSVPEQELDMSIGKVQDLGFDDNQYYVETILDYKIVKGKEFYLIKWLYWPQTHNSWEPQENVDINDTIVKEFFKENSEALEKHQELMEEAQDQNQPLVNGGDVDELQKSEQYEKQVPEFPRASIIIGESLYPQYISESTIQELSVKVPFQIIGRVSGTIPNFPGDTAILVVWTEGDDELRVVLESVARKHFPEKFNEFLESDFASEHF